MHSGGPTVAFRGANRCIQGGQPLHSGGPTVAFRGANRCIQGGQPLHSGGPTVAFRGANRCIQGGQPLHSGGPTVAFRGANRCIQGGQPLHQHTIRPIKHGVRPSYDPDLDRGEGVDGGLSAVASPPSNSKHPIFHGDALPFVPGAGHLTGLLCRGAAKMAQPRRRAAVAGPARG